MSATVTGERRTVQGPTLPYLVGLDGLRAVAVLAVVLYHAEVPWIPGGFLGVDVFFVISGFLITSLLLTELSRTATIDYRDFYLRRARRLLPAFFCMVFACAVLVATVASDGAAAFRRDLPGALFYLANWSSIVTESSYFEAIGRPAFLKHVWSLALEEQFYLIWPALALVAFRRGGSRTVGVVAASGALLSTVAMFIGSILSGMPSAQDPSRLYFGTDTHAMSVLAGAALACVWRPGRTAPILAPRAQVVVTALGISGLFGLLLSFALLGEGSTFLYRGGFLFVAALSALVVAAASHRGVSFGRWLGIRPLKWVGVRSYGVYLWHWPVFLVTRPGLDLPVDGVPALVLRIGLVLLVAEASFRYIEMPVRRGELRKFVTSLQARGLPSWTPLEAVASGLAIFGLLAVGVRIAVAPVAVAGSGFTAAQMAEIFEPQAPLERDYLRLAQADSRDRRPRLTAFGDSVLLGASRTLGQDINLDLDARVAEQAAQMQRVVESRAEAGDLSPYVLLHIGNNGRVTESQLRATLNSLKSRARVGLVTIRVPRSWQNQNNTLFRTVVADYPNVVIVDWGDLAARNRSFLGPDGVHLTGSGARAYSNLISQSLDLSIAAPNS